MTLNSQLNVVSVGKKPKTNLKKEKHEHFCFPAFPVLSCSSFPAASQQWGRTA